MAKKIDKQSLLASITFSLLLCLIVIQFLFLAKSAKLEEKHFNHRVILALREARNEIAREANACNHMHNYVCGNQCTSAQQHINFQIADSIIKSNLAIHKIELDYTFEFINEQKEAPKKQHSTCYEQSLNGLLAQNGIKLIIVFPEHKQFLLAQVGIIFYVSIGAIIFVMISYVITSRLFRKEKRILNNTKDFIDNMVHEFQTPIANIKLASNLIQKNTNNGISSKKISHYTSLIQNENTKMESQVKDILSVAAMTTSKTPMRNVNMHQVIEQSLLLYKDSIHELGGRFDIKLNADKYVIKGELPYISHAIINLIDNALKYTPSHPIISIKTYNEKNKFYLSITDNGIGIAPDNYQSIFEKYYRVSNGNIHNTKGFGLGLDFVKNVVENHHGSISLDSKLDKGSTFTLSFKYTNS
ncbi:sensor histidine kinase [Saccharicrinis fermentans]|uniref:histidine kinase n=1 Tax=Saccharicrinis fermentans DSM 9555 = JCM 21142 TaxID=869213 RepID=W7YBA5_9BACT|nr:HAMP domain-containing sensor histidine kinase [Saccharicrinis fermentans]GAF01681.1 alkaline phosphatase synthesis sensor protein PhoR [Saccharicrinis fermentans DSM 9555 = JCM 21142]